MVYNGEKKEKTHKSALGGFVACARCTDETKQKNPPRVFTPWVKNLRTKVNGCRLFVPRSMPHCSSIVKDNWKDLFAATKNAPFEE